MGLAAEVVRLNFEKELARARSVAETRGFDLDADVDALTIRATFVAADGERFILVGAFDDYKAKPPLLEFEEPGTGVRGSKRAYPQTGNDSFFHGHPCICAPFSRKAYGNVHNDWDFSNWTNSQANGTDWRQYSTLASMLVLVHSRLTFPDLYKPGRMG